MDFASPHHHATHAVPEVAFLTCVCKVGFFCSPSFSWLPSSSPTFSFLAYFCPHLRKKKKKFFCPTVSICSLEIACLSRVEDKTRTKGDLAGRHQSLQRIAWVHTCTDCDTLRERLSSGPLGVWSKNWPSGAVLWLPEAGGTTDPHTCCPRSPWIGHRVVILLGDLGWRTWLPLGCLRSLCCPLLGRGGSWRDCRYRFDGTFLLG